MAAKFVTYPTEMDLPTSINFMALEISRSEPSRFIFVRLRIKEKVYAILLNNIAELYASE